jgi:hypothetical protein
VEILAAIDPPLKPLPAPRSKRPSAVHGTNGSTANGGAPSSMLLRERRKPKTPPNEKVTTFISETRLHEEFKLVKINSRSPRGSNMHIPATNSPPVERVPTPKVAERGETATPDAPGTGSINEIAPESDQKTPNATNSPPSTVLSTTHVQPSAPPSSQTTSVPRKLPRIILRVREPGT